MITKDDQERVITTRKARKVNPNTQYYSVLQAAFKAEESRQTIQRRIDTGVIQAISTSLGFLIESDELERYLNIRGEKVENRRGWFRTADLVAAKTDSQTGSDSQPESPAHVDYPHEPGYLNDCPACESECHCSEGATPCVYCENESHSQESNNAEEPSHA